MVTGFLWVKDGDELRQYAAQWAHGHGACLEISRGGESLHKVSAFSTSSSKSDIPALFHKCMKREF